MEQTDTARPADGSIADIAARLALWGRRAPDGLARVEFDSEFSRLKVVEQLSALCAEADIPFYEIDIPQSTPAPEIVRFLKDKMAPLPHGVVSLAGWATAFPPDVPLIDSLRVLNYNRENLTQFPLCQIWWLTRSLAGEFIRSIPDLNSWFIVRLSLTENIAAPPSAERLSIAPIASPEEQESARRRAADLVTRFENALKAEVSLPELSSLAKAAASHLDNVGLGREAQECSAALVEQIRQSTDYQGYEAGTLNLSDRQRVIFLEDLAHLYKMQEKYTAAAKLFEEVIILREKVSGPEDIEFSTSVNNLAYTYEEQGLLAKAKPLYERALAIREKALGPEHPYVATSLNNLAALYEHQGRLAEAEPLHKRALAIREKALGPEHPDVAVSLSNLALLYDDQGRSVESEPLHKRSLIIREKALGLEHPSVASSLNNLALVYQRQGNFATAESVYRRALALYEKALGQEHPSVANCLNNLGGLLEQKGEFAASEPLHQRALAMRERLWGLEHPDVATSLNNLAGVYEHQGRLAEAEPLFRRALEINEKMLGINHPDTATILENCSVLLNKRGKKAEAALMFAQAKGIREKHARDNPPA